MKMRTLKIMLPQVSPSVPESLEPKAAQAFLQSIVDTLRDPVLVLDASLRVVSASRSFYQTFGVTSALTVGQPLYALGNGQWNIPALRLLLEDVLPRHSEVTGYEVTHEFPGLGKRVMLLDARTLYHPGDGAIMVFLALVDVTQQRIMEMEQEATQQRLQTALEYERNIADTLQQAMLRTVAEDAYPGIAVAAVHEAVREEAKVGGDFHDLFRLDNDRVAFVMGDAMGKGLVATLRTSSVKAALRLLLREQYSPARALARLNLMLCDAERLDDLPVETIMVALLGVIELDTGKTVIACAGAEAPLLVHPAIPASDTADGKKGFTAESVDVRGPLLGINPHSEYEQTTLQLLPGDLLITVTDGITEARNEARHFFGYEGLIKAALRKAAAATVNEIGHGILEAARTFANGKLHDDACIVLVRRAEPFP